VRFNVRFNVRVNDERWFPPLYNPLSTVAQHNQRPQRAGWPSQRWSPRTLPRLSTICVGLSQDARLGGGVTQSDLRPLRHGRASDLRGGCWVSARPSNLFLNNWPTFEEAEITPRLPCPCQQPAASASQRVRKCKKGEIGSV